MKCLKTDGTSHNVAELYIVADRMQQNLLPKFYYIQSKILLLLKLYFILKAEGKSSGKTLL